MQLHEQIKHVKRSYETAKPRSIRKTETHRDHVKLMLKQLRKEIRQDKRK